MAPIMSVLQKLAASICLLTTGCYCLDVSYPLQPREVWRKTFNSIGEGNGVFVAPSGDLVAAVAQNGIVRAYRPSDGEVLWTYSPELIDGGSVSCKSGITFTSDNVVYSVIDTTGGAITSRVIAIASDGTKRMESSPLLGEGAGSPQTTRDGRYIVTTHNHQQKGQFSILDLSLAQQDQPLSPILQYSSRHEAFNVTTSFSAVGYFHRPSGGNYASPTNQGRNNFNDVFVWMSDTNTDIVNNRGDPQAGTGQMYVFQFPKDFDPTSTNVTQVGEVLPIGNVRDYQAKTRPILINEGQSMYWAMVRGEIRAWVDNSFSRGQTGILRSGRGDPPFTAPRAPPTCSKTGDGHVYGVGAAALVWKTAADLTNATIVPTDSIVSSRMVLTPEEEYVFYGTQGGLLYQARTTDMSTRWTVGGSGNAIPFVSIQGDIAIHPSGTLLFVGDNQGTGVGQVVALEVGTLPDSAEPSTIPTFIPSSHPSVTPSASPMPSSPPSPLPSFVEQIIPGTIVPTGTPTSVFASMSPTFSEGLGANPTPAPSLQTLKPRPPTIVFPSASSTTKPHPFLHFLTSCCLGLAIVFIVTFL